uniref:Uncharacterized protein n=1 Tax=Anguilla anguilla TaxID=7936 RepID=A0A0E9PWP5_ANGAN
MTACQNHKPPAAVKLLSEKRPPFAHNRLFSFSTTPGVCTGVCACVRIHILYILTTEIMRTKSTL